MSLIHALQPRAASLLLAAAATAILLTALGLQYLGGLPPCHLCVLQRYPFAALIAVGILGWYWQPRLMLALAALVLLTSAGLAGYHLGVEQGWWALPAGCTAGGDARSIEELRRMLTEAPPTCDQMSFTFLGLSLAAWNGMISLALAALCAAFALGVGRQPHRTASQAG
jgi:disulfide bond formation protein DsbB